MYNFKNIAKGSRMVINYNTMYINVFIQCLATVDNGN